MPRKRDARRRWISGFFLCALALLVTGCKKEDVVNPPTPIPPSFTGISRSDSAGNFATADSDDWKPIPAAGMQFQPQGAYPNPCLSATGFNIGWHLLSPDSVLITINDTPEHIVKTPLSRILEPGNYVTNVRMGLLDPGIYRLYFYIVRPETTYVTYGDIQTY